MKTNTIKTKISKVAKAAVVFAAISSTQAMDLVMVTGEESRTVLQSTLTLKTNNQWQVSAYSGTNIQMVDDIRQRAVTSQLPNAAQIPGATIRRWAALGFINSVDETAMQDQWNSRLPEVIQQDISFQEKTYAVPTQIFRSNWMWMNRSALQQGEDIAPAPLSWKAFFELVQSGSAKKIISVNDPAQNALILESVMLGLKGSEFYRKSFVELDYQTLKSSDMVDVFSLLALLRPYLNELKVDTWRDAALALSEGRGDILFAGDWIKPYLADAQGQLSESLVCAPYPEASATFLYNLNSVVLFKETANQQAQMLADLLFTESLLTDLNLREGSIPARLDITPWGFDRCAVRSMREFRSAHTTNTLQPSLSTGMAAPEMVQKSVYNAVNDFMTDASITPEQGAKNLAKAVRVAVYKI
jgi:glucose/mannose transport system substrate-binding protein